MNARARHTYNRPIDRPFGIENPWLTGQSAIPLARALRIIEKAASGQMRGGVPRTKARQRSGARRTDRDRGLGQS